MGDVTSITCPVCEGPVPAGAEAFPFCSRRCRLLDLDKWISGKYVVSRPMDARDLEELEATLEGRPPSSEVLGRPDDDDARDDEA